MDKCVFCREPAPAQPKGAGWLKVAGYLDTPGHCCPCCARTKISDWLALVEYAQRTPQAGERRRTLAAALKSLRAG